MTPDEFADKMAELFPAEGYDTEAAHASGDSLMVDQLVDLGYDVGARIFLDADRYYG
jgi:hypothetical protein